MHEERARRVRHGLNVAPRERGRFGPAKARRKQWPGDRLVHAPATGVAFGILCGSAQIGRVPFLDPIGHGRCDAPGGPACPYGAFALGSRGSDDSVGSLFTSAAIT